MLKRTAAIFRQMLTFLLLCITVNVNAFVVVIDAGHGGHDSGALGKLCMEKDLNLSVAKQVGKLISENFDDVDVLYTRTTDVFITLQGRADFANKHNADLFISIHTNSANDKTAKGAETFTLGVDKMQSNLDVAMRENSVILLEDDYQTRYQGFDPNSVESYIMFEFMQDRHLDNSIQFASLIQDQFTQKLQRFDRGVKQAGFLVLHRSACPSVLVEMGFISNAEEEKYLKSDNGKAEISKAIYNAFCQYKQKLDKKAQQVSQESKTDQTVKSEQTKNTDTAKSGQTKKASEQTKKTDAVKSEQTKKADDQTKKTDTAKSGQTQKADNSSAQTPTKQQSKPKPVFRVQIFSVSQPLKAGDPTFKGLKGCKYTKDGKFYKYTYGEESDYKKITAIRDEVKKKFGDCFIVAFLGDKQILVKDALKMQ